MHLIFLKFVSLSRVAKVGVEGSIPFARSKFFNELPAPNDSSNLCVSYRVSKTKAVENFRILGWVHAFAGCLFRQVANFVSFQAEAQ
jgi:hypothetical protein